MLWSVESDRGAHNITSTGINRFLEKLRQNLQTFLQLLLNFFLFQKTESLFVIKCGIEVMCGVDFTLNGMYYTNKMLLCSRQFNSTV